MSPQDRRGPRDQELARYLVTAQGYAYLAGWIDAQRAAAEACAAPELEAEDEGDPQEDRRCLACGRLECWCLDATDLGPLLR